tara:strand:- start:598 stop:1314 length:717 start_codon:yes stop_codon:yes gene_type:complete
MKVAIIFIGTNKYLDFLPTYYENIEKYFLPNSQKTIFAFTDGELDDTPDNIKVYHQEHLEWPYITLKRFEIINKARADLDSMDWLVFLDADTRVVDTVTEEEFFSDKPYFGVHHPCHALKMQPHTEYPGAFETNTNSRAGVTEEDDTSMYYQGCLWGGRVPEVLDMIEELDSRVEEDLSNDVIAVWHDESQLNKFYSEVKEDVHLLGPQYAYPEVFKDYCNFDPKIVHLAKDNSAYQI